MAGRADFVGIDSFSGQMQYVNYAAGLRVRLASPMRQCGFTSSIRQRRMTEVCCRKTCASGIRDGRWKGENVSQNSDRAADIVSIDCFRIDDREQESDERRTIRRNSPRKKTAEAALRQLNEEP